MFEDSNASCPLEAGPVTLIARRYIPEDVPKVSVQGNITLTNQNEEILTCTTPPLSSPLSAFFVCLCRLETFSMACADAREGVHIDVVLQSRDGSKRWSIF